MASLAAAAGRTVFVGKLRADGACTIGNEPIEKGGTAMPQRLLLSGIVAIGIAASTIAERGGAAVHGSVGRQRHRASLRARRAHSLLSPLDGRRRAIAPRCARARRS